MLRLDYKNFLIVVLFIIIGVQTAIYKGFGDDLDSHALILTFMDLYENGYYSPSRYQGSLVAEIFYGFLGYNYGSFLSAFLSYIFFISSLIIFFKSFSNAKFDNKDLLLFIVVCFSNPVLFLDNTNPSDFPLSLFLLSIGIYSLKNNYKILPILFFGLSIGTRIEFSLYILFIIMYEFLSDKKKFKEIFNITIYSFFLGSLFYVPILLLNEFSLSFLTKNVVGVSFEGQVIRFFYKSYLSLGVFSSLFILIFFILNFKKVKNVLVENKDLTILIILISIMFLYMPTKTSIFSLAIIFIYLILFKAIDKKFYIYSIIFLNFLFYLISYQIFELKYKNSANCDPIEAIGGEFSLKIDEGYFFKRTKNMEKQIKCASRQFLRFYQFGDKAKKYIEGNKIR